MKKERVPVLRREEATLGLLAVEGRTITVIGRIRTGRRGAARRDRAVVPTRLELLDEQGRRQVVRVHDVDRALKWGLGATTVAAAAVTLWRAARR